MIKSCRERAGMTQVQLAEALAVDRSAVAKWETGAAMPRASTLVKLSQVLECSVDALLAKKE